MPGVVYMIVALDTACSYGCGQEFYDPPVRATQLIIRNRSRVNA